MDFIGGWCVIAGKMERPVIMLQKSAAFLYFISINLEDKVHLATNLIIVVQQAMNPYHRNFVAFFDAP